MRLMLQLVFIGTLLSVSGGRTDPRGVDPDFVSFYDSAKNFQCLDGSSIIDYRKVNDDYCDCEDGSDEPGTSACSNGSFFCYNMGFMQSRIPSSRVNDGICDCCDGSDEWDSSSCHDVCFEMGALARAQREHRIKIIEEGLKLKEGLVLSAQKIYSQKSEELLLRENELKELESQRSTANSIKESAEILERAALEVYKEIEEKERLMKEEEERLQKEEEFHDRFNNLDVNSDGNIEASELQLNIKFDQNNDGIVSEEEAAFYMSGLNSYDYDTFKVQGWPLMEVVLENKETPTKPAVEHDTDEGQKEGSDYEDYNDEDDDVKPPHLKNTNEDTDEGEEEEEEEHLDKEEEETPKDDQEEATENSVRYDTETQKLIDDANKARADHDHYDRKVKDIENDISHLRSTLDKDYGNQNEFLALVNECFEFTDQEYVYKMCTFDHCTQRSKNGGSETRLGNWAHWSKAYSEMMYEKGTQCWNGPQRSTSVLVSCGIENKLTSVSEPGKCEYVFEFETPAACFPVSKDNIGLHDEL